MLCVRNSGDTCLADYSVPCGIDRGHAVAFRWPMNWSEESRAASLAHVALWQGWWELGWACPPELLPGDCPALRPQRSWTSYMKAQSSRWKCSSDRDQNGMPYYDLPLAVLSAFLPFPICCSQEARPRSGGREVKSASWWKRVKKLDTVVWNHHTWIETSYSVSASSSIVTIDNPPSLLKTFCKF